MPTTGSRSTGVSAPTACALLSATTFIAASAGGATPPHLGVTDRESTQYFEVEAMPPTGAPNIIYLVLDDVGFADLGSFGSEISTPNMDRLAARGLRYNNFHTQAICSPTRAALLTGRNAHTVGVGTIPGLNNGFPSGQGLITPSAATIAEILQSQGYRTYAVGKWHLAALMQTSSRSQWPLGRGFDQFYGFLGAMTDQYTPELIQDNSILNVPLPKDYHLSEDLTSKAIEYLATETSVSPERPFFLYLAYGAAHAPHQVPRQYVDKYVPVFAKGWDQTRTERLARQKVMGIMPANAELSDHNARVKSWESLSSREKEVYVRFQATYAGFVEHTDAQIGRLLDFLERTGRADNTIIVLMSDNGASSEGHVDGTLSELRTLNQRDDSVEEMARHLAEFGSAATFQSYPLGWAQAGNTPFPRYKTTNWEGGTRAPLIISWPARIRAQGAVRRQFIDTVNITPTILSLVHVPEPEVYRGIPQIPVAGRSFEATFDDPTAPPPRHTQYFEIVGQRALWHDGWMAIATHEPGTSFESDTWQLFNLDADLSESHDVSSQHPQLLAELKARWWSEAGQYGVLPLTEQPVADLFKVGPSEESASSPTRFKFARDPRKRYVLYPEATSLLRQEAPSLSASSYRITVQLRRSAGTESGVLVASGDQFGGYVLYVQDGRLCYTYNDLGHAYSLTAAAASIAGARSISYAFDRRTSSGGIGRLRVDDRVVAQGPIESPSSTLSAFSMFDIGRDSGGHVSPAYPSDTSFDAPAVMIDRVIIETAEGGGSEPDQVSPISSGSTN